MLPTCKLIVDQLSSLAFLFPLSLKRAVFDLNCMSMLQASDKPVADLPDELTGQHCLRQRTPDAVQNQDRGGKRSKSSPGHAEEIKAHEAQTCQVSFCQNVSQFCCLHGFTQLACCLSDSPKVPGVNRAFRSQHDTKNVNKVVGRIVDGL